MVLINKVINLFDSRKGCHERINNHFTAKYPKTRRGRLFETPSS